MGKGQRKRTERRAEQEGGGEEVRPMSTAPEPTTDTAADAAADESEASEEVVDDPEAFFIASSEALNSALEFGENALDLLANGDRVQSSAEMQFAALKAQVALVEAVRDVGVGMRMLDRRLNDRKRAVDDAMDQGTSATHGAATDDGSWPAEPTECGAVLGNDDGHAIRATRRAVQLDSWLYLRNLAGARCGVGSGARPAGGPRFCCPGAITRGLAALPAR